MLCNFFQKVIKESQSNNKNEVCKIKISIIIDFLPFVHCKLELYSLCNIFKCFSFRFPPTLTTAIHFSKKHFFVLWLESKVINLYFQHEIWLESLDVVKRSNFIKQKRNTFVAMYIWNVLKHYVRNVFILSWLVQMSSYWFLFPSSTQHFNTCKGWWIHLKCIHHKFCSDGIILD